MKGMNSSMTKDSHRSEPSAFCMYIPDPGGGSFLKLAQTTDGPRGNNIPASALGAGCVREMMLFLAAGDGRMEGDDQGVRG